MKNVNIGVTKCFSIKIIDFLSFLTIYLVEMDKVQRNLEQIDY